MLPTVGDVVLTDDALFCTADVAESHASLVEHADLPVQIQAWIGLALQLSLRGEKLVRVTVVPAHRHPEQVVEFQGGCVCGQDGLPASHR